jgi:hypothetical protein
MSDQPLKSSADPVRVSEFPYDLIVGAKSLTLTLSLGAGSVPIPDTARIVGVCPVSSTAIRVGLEAPEADGTKTGTASATDLKKGVPVLSSAYTWFNVAQGISRTFYVKGGTSDVVEVVVM